MRYVGAFIAVSCFTGVIAAVGCGSKSSTPGTGGGSSSQSSASSSSSAVSSGTGGGGTGGGGTGGSAPMVSIDCPTGTPPSGGSCVVITSDAGVEPDAGATATTCNPITNDGCTGTEVCNPDNSGMFYVCESAGSPADVACGAAGATMTSTCAVGGLLVQLQSGQFVCVQMCCTAADCGGSPSQCDTGALMTPLPSGVGVCDTPG
jgi:hypothetical protein